MKKKFLLGIASISCLLLLNVASASVITWQAPTPIVTADQALSQAGSVDYAVAWTGLNNATTVTLSNSQTVTFQAGKIDGSGLVEVSGSYGICGGNCAQYGGTSNSAFNTVMNGFSYDGVETMTLTSLNIGQAYTVQIFSLDDRGCCGAKTQVFTGLSGASNSTASFAHNANDYVEGTFIADSTTETISAIGQSSNDCGGSVCTNLNAVVLYNNISAVPEPETYGMLLAGLGLMGFMTRRKSKNK